MNPEELHEYLHECAYNGEDPMQKSLEAVKRIPFFGRLLYAYFKKKLERDRNKSVKKTPLKKWALATDLEINNLITGNGLFVPSTEKDIEQMEVARRVHRRMEGFDE